MTAPSRGLPEFSNPPLTELALALHFDALPSLRTAHLGLFWERLRQRFPWTEEQPPLEPTIEKFGIPGRPAFGVQLELASAPPVPRLWFLSHDRSELLQVQPNFFARNWRRVSGQKEYPRFKRFRASFEADLDTFRQFVADEQLGEITPRQCEITYTNHIDRAGSWNGQLESVVAWWHPRSSEGFPPAHDARPEQVRFAAQYVIPAADQEPLGRLHIEVQPGTRLADGEPILRLTLVARGRPDGHGLEGVRGFLDVGHEWAVQAFAAITTPEAQRIWGRHDGR